MAVGRQICTVVGTQVQVIAQNYAKEFILMEANVLARLGVADVI